MNILAASDHDSSSNNLTLQSPVGPPSIPPGFLDFAGLCDRVPLSERTLRTAIKRRQIPHIRLPGARRLLFDWPSVQAALARYQKGGTEE